ncbi:hypothetical protein E2C01_056708 [Portunus trituberculatus]|uniref:Uncharacterized protein n=1 Tax=Portunus trituberculatus TaxID=210409 RepID=A0A5B7GYH5_PORTR|nr:hypothetical protein [Portunus trituberculatus]
MYVSMSDTITSVMRSAQRDVSLMQKQLSFQGKISITPQVPSTSRGKTPEAPRSTLGDLEEGLEK